MKLKLIKIYPLSPELGTVIENTKAWPHDNVFSNGNILLKSEEALKFPEFWEPVEELNYEILTVTASEKNKNNTNKEFAITYKTCNKDLEFWDINSVKRLSDGGIFTIGDSVSVIDSVSNVCIDKFDARTVLWAQYQGGSCTLNLLKKVTNPIFTTVDGVEIFEGNSYWYLITNKHPIENMEWVPKLHAADWDNCGEVPKPPLGSVQFSTKEKAEDYVIMNKPCISISEIINLTDLAKKWNLPRLEQLVKSKL